MVDTVRVDEDGGRLMIIDDLELVSKENGP